MDTSTTAPEYIKTIKNQKGGGGMVGVSVTLRDLKDAGGVVPIKSPFKSWVWPLRKLDGSEKMIVNTASSPK